MAELKIERVGYRYPNLIFSLNGQTLLLRIKEGRGKKWIKPENVESVNIYPTIENDMNGSLHVPIRNMEKLVRDILNNFPTRMANTNEPARNFIWGWRHGIFWDKSGILVSER
jgi:hypothetical protein